MSDGVAPYLVEMKVKNNRLLDALARAFPEAKTMKDYAEAIGDFNYQLLISYISMHVHPMNRYGQWTPNAEKISAATGELCEYLFDPILYPASKQRYFKALHPAELEPLQLQVSPEEEYDKKEMTIVLDGLLKKLTPRKEKILRSYFGVGAEQKNMEEIGDELEITKARVGMIINDSILLLNQRHSGTEIYKELKQFHA